MKTAELQDPSKEDCMAACRTVSPLIPDELIHRAWDAMTFWGEGTLTNASGVFIRWVWYKGIHHIYISNR